MRPTRCLSAATAIAVAYLVFGSSFCVANTLTVNVADYNAAQVSSHNGTVVVPANVGTYSVTAGSLAMGSSFIVTLPTGFLFQTVPSLTNTGASTFTLSGGGAGSNSATFTVGGSALASGQSVSLGSFSVAGASALETAIPKANALPLSMQSIGNDPAPLAAGAFASEPGIQGVSVGAVQFIDTNPPSSGTRFVSKPDSLTAVIAAVAISAQTTDATTHSVPVLGADGKPNSLAATDGATVTFGGDWTGIAKMFSSTNSNCSTPLAAGLVTQQLISVLNVPLNQEIFICAIADGTTAMHANPLGYTPVTIEPGTSTDFLSAATTDEFPGFMAQQGTPVPPDFSESFGAPSIPFGTTTSLSFTIGNANNCNTSGAGVGGGCGPIDFNIAFTDTLPTGVVVATPNGVSGNCGGTVVATAGSSSISLSSGSVAGGDTCKFSVNVTGIALGAQVNTTSAISYNYTVNKTLTSATGVTATSTLTVVKAATTLSVSAPQGTAGEITTVTAALGVPGAGTPTGNIQISDGAGDTCAITPPATTCELRPTHAGSFTLTANYAGDTNFIGSSASASWSVNPASTSVALVSSVNPSLYSHAVTFTASVTPAANNLTPTGSMSFADGATTLCANVTLSNGQAACSTSTLSVGTHTIQASYAGDANTSASSVSITQTVNKDMTTMTLAASPNPVGAGQPVTLTATVYGDPPTGTVTFYDGATVLGTGTLVPAGPLSSTASLTAGPLKTGTHNLSATYAGDGNNQASASAVVAVSVNAPVVAAPIDRGALILLGALMGLVVFLRSRRAVT